MLSILPLLKQTSEFRDLHRLRGSPTEGRFNDSCPAMPQPTENSRNAWLLPFREVDWPIPPYLQLGGFLNPLAKAIKDASKDEKLEIVRGKARERLLAGIPRVHVPRPLQQNPPCAGFQPVRLTSRSAPIFAATTFNAVTGLLPVLEGIIRKMAARQNRDVGQGTQMTESRTADHSSIANSSHLTVTANALLCWRHSGISSRDRTLFKRPGDYDGFNEFNRHGILHGIFENFGQDINFLSPDYLARSALFFHRPRRGRCVDVRGPGNPLVVKPRRQICGSTLFSQGVQNMKRKTTEESRTNCGPFDLSEIFRRS